MNQETLDRIREKAPGLAAILDDDHKRKQLGYYIIIFVTLICLCFLAFLNRHPKHDDVAVSSVTPDMAAGEDQEINEKSNIKMFDASKDLFNKRSTMSEFDGLSDVEIGDLSGKETPSSGNGGGNAMLDQYDDLRNQIQQSSKNLENNISGATEQTTRSQSSAPRTTRTTTDAQNLARQRQDELLIAQGFDPESYHKEGKLVPLAEAQAARDAKAKQQDEPRIDLSGASAPVRKTDAISSLDDAPGGIGGLSSLDSDNAYVSQDMNHPFKVMFIRDEKLSSGQRVTLRLLEDMMIGSVLVPKNTHLMAICTVGDRMTLNISSIEMNGAIYNVNFEAFDTDGGRGIYCAQSGANKAAKEAGSQASMLGRSYIGGLAGVAAGTIVNAGAMIAQSAKGKVTVTTTSGYTFYIMQVKR